MNRLYYSNFCPYSKDVLEFIKQNNLINKLSFLCVDNRVQDKQTGIIYIITEDKKHKDALPPNIQDVPALLLIREQYRVILGKDIMNYFAPQIKNVFSEINTVQPSPLTNNLQSFSLYGDDEPNNENKNKIGYIETPPEDFISNKIGENITIDLIEKQRNAELEKIIEKGANISI
jgi:glutaredoxin-related protein